MKCVSPRIEVIWSIQEALKENGFDPGPVDGDLGPKTQDALRNFQVKNGLSATGAINKDTILKLGVSAGRSAVLAAAIEM